MLNWIMSLFTGQQEASPLSQAVQLFMQGHTINRIAAYDHPDMEMIAGQRLVESDLRNYLEQLIETIGELRSELQQAERYER